MPHERGIAGTPPTGFDFSAHGGEMSGPKRYVVGNPRGIAVGQYVLRTDKKDYQEGDAITAQDLGDDWDTYIERGYVVEAR
jgi:hypothetical protein